VTLPLNLAERQGLRVDQLLVVSDAGDALRAAPPSRQPDTRCRDRVPVQEEDRPSRCRQPGEARAERVGQSEGLSARGAVMCAGASTHAGCQVCDRC